MAAGLKEEPALQAEVEELHAIVYTAPAAYVAQTTRDLADRTKGETGAGDWPNVLLDKARVVKF